MIQRLPIPFAQIKVSNTYRNLLNEILQMTDYLYWEKEVNKIIFY